MYYKPLFKLLITGGVFLLWLTISMVWATLGYTKVYDSRPNSSKPLTANNLKMKDKFEDMVVFERTTLIHLISNNYDGYNISDVKYDNSENNISSYGNMFQYIQRTDGFYVVLVFFILGSAFSCFIFICYCIK